MSIFTGIVANLIFLHFDYSLRLGKLRKVSVKVKIKVG